MRLYQTYLSPFPSRVRLLLYAKGLDFEIVEPPGFHGDPRPKGEYLDVNPIGRIPTLVLDDGTVIPESEVICEFLEEAYPERALRPADPVQRSRMRLLSRISDTYLMMAMLPLFVMSALPPKQWNHARIANQHAEIVDALSSLEHFVGTEGYAVGNSITQADGALVPALLLVAEWLPVFGGPDVLNGVPRVAAYWEAIQRDALAARLADETRTALRESIARAKRARAES